MKYLTRYGKVFELNNDESAMTKSDREEIENYFLEITDSVTDCEVNFVLEGWLKVDFSDKSMAGDDPYFHRGWQEGMHQVWLFQVLMKDKAISFERILKCYNRLEKDESYFTFNFRANINQEIDRNFEVTGRVFFDFYIVKR